MNHNSVALIVTAWDDIITSFTCMLFCGTKHGRGTGGSRILGKGGSDKNTHNCGRHAPSRDSKGSGGALIAPPVGSGASPQPLFCFCVNLA